MVDDNVVTIAAIGVVGFLTVRFMGAASGPGEAADDLGGFIGGIANGASQSVNELLGGTADIADALNPFTRGPVLGWI